MKKKLLIGVGRPIKLSFWFSSRLNFASLNIEKNGMKSAQNGKYIIEASKFVGTL